MSGSRPVVRPTSAADLPAALSIADWARPDRWQPGARSAVATIADRIVGVSASMPNAVHPVRRPLLVGVAVGERRAGVGSALVSWMRRETPGPFSAKAVPGSAADLFLRAVGAHRYQLCPAQRIDVQHRDLPAWIKLAAAGATARSASDVPIDQLIEAVAERYWWQHGSWSPMSSRQIVRDAIESQVRTDTDLPGSAVVVRDGRISAVADLYPADGSGSRTAAVEAVDPAAPSARGDVAACTAYVIGQVQRSADRYLEWGGHVTDPHFYPMLRSLPAVHGDECELVEIPAL